MEKKSVVLRTEFKLTQKRSVFVGILCPLRKEEDLKVLLSQIKLEHQSCTHVAYAAICGNYLRASDDKEPSGTAGVQILSELQKSKLNEVALFVVRYFGGVKLGKVGLADAYRECANGTICKASFATKKVVLKLEAKVDPKNLGKLISKVAKKNGKFETNGEHFAATFVDLAKDELKKEIGDLASDIKIEEEERWQQ